ncbi:MAG: hypothetical protein IJ180_07550 [Bacteroidales bacterium]|nr:hypothetical protein [Bacteroidales bacterium]
MLNIIKEQLENIIDRINTGNSVLTEEDSMMLIDTLTKINSPMLSKCQAMNLLNIKRSRFDELVSLGELPQGKKQLGFKEIFWYKKDLVDYINKKKKKDAIHKR